MWLAGSVLPLSVPKYTKNGDTSFNLDYVYPDAEVLYMLLLDDCIFFSSALVLQNFLGSLNQALRNHLCLTQEFTHTSSKYAIHVHITAAIIIIFIINA